jgi:hypothetical protein
MISTMDKELNAWFALLSGNLSYSGKSVKVYKEDVPEIFSPLDSEHYVILIAESESDDSNKRSFATNTVISVDIVTKFVNNIDRSVVDDIDGQINALALTSPYQSGLASASGLQRLNIKRETTTYITEKTTQETIYRKVSRYISRILQTS